MSWSEDATQADTSPAAHATRLPAATPARIAEAVEALDTLDQRPLAEHVEVYHQLHAELQAALAEIDGS